MLTNDDLFEGYTDESLSGYLSKTEMWAMGDRRGNPGICYIVEY
jgi:hypothetical protein